MNKDLESILNVLLDNKAEEVCYLNASNINPLCDYYILCNANSTRHALALAHYVEDEIYKNNGKVKHIEGNENSKWVLVDGLDFIVHIFVNEAREFYSLEKLWSNEEIYKVG